MTLALAACGAAPSDAGAPGIPGETSGASGEPAKADPSEQLPPGADPIAWFGERLFPLVNQDSADAVGPVYSPLSVYLALGMAADGARGATADQFAQVMGGDREAVNFEAAALLKDYIQFEGTPGAEPLGEDGEPVDGPTIRVADSVWVDEGFEVLEDYARDLKELYQSEAHQVDLQLPASVDQINEWVSERTEGLIDQILSQDDTDALVVFLANALYFNGSWQHTADPGATAPADFTTAEGQTVQADMMTLDESSAGHLQLDDGTEGALLNYTGGRFAMLAVMPGDGIDSVDWDGQTILDWLGALDIEPAGGLGVKLPKWEADSGPLDLVPALQAAGLEDAFDGQKADLSGIGAGDLYISDVSHRAVVKVDERGTEAAAATSVGVRDTALALPARTVEFNRPFVYSIIDTELNVPLFLGVVGNPTAQPQGRP
jgi:serpin B